MADWQTLCGWSAQLKDEQKSNVAHRGSWLQLGCRRQDFNFRAQQWFVSHLDLMSFNMTARPRIWKSVFKLWCWETCLASLLLLFLLSHTHTHRSLKSTCNSQLSLLPGRIQMARASLLTSNPPHSAFPQVASPPPSSSSVWYPPYPATRSPHPVLSCSHFPGISKHTW